MGENSPFHSQQNGTKPHRQQDRLNVIDDLNEKVDLFGWPFQPDLMDHAAKARSSPV